MSSKQKARAISTQKPSTIQSQLLTLPVHKKPSKKLSTQKAGIIPGLMNSTTAAGSVHNMAYQEAAAHYTPLSANSQFFWNQMSF